jgi:hypothetical protein
MLPAMPKCIYSAVGKNRKLFRDHKKEKGKHFSPKRKDMQLKFNDIRLTPP